MRFPVLLSLRLAPTAALADGGAGGVTLTTSNLGPMGRDGVLDAGNPICFGGVGFSADGHRRIGGEGQVCGSPGTTMVFAGPRSGWQGSLPVGYGVVSAGSGLGWIDARDDDEDRFRALYAYVRPEVAYGLPIGIGSLEASAWLDVPIPLVQSLHGDMGPIASFTRTGVALTFVIGDARGRDRAPEPAGEPVAEIEPPPPPAAPPDVAPPPEPVYDDEPAAGWQGDVEEESSDRPLAIPADPPPPRPR